MAPSGHLSSRSQAHVHACLPTPRNRRSVLVEPPVMSADEALGAVERTGPPHGSPPQLEAGSGDAAGRRRQSENGMSRPGKAGDRKGHVEVIQRRTVA